MQHDSTRVTQSILIIIYVFQDIMQKSLKKGLNESTK